MSARNIIELRDVFVDEPDSYEMFVERAGNRLASQIREARGRVDFTQLELAQFCTRLAERYGADDGRINQPYIAQLESGQGNPSLYKVLWILWCLDLAHRGYDRVNQQYCKVHMTPWKDIAWARSDERIRDVVDRMKKLNYYQIPVVDKDVDTRNTMVRYDAVIGTFTGMESLAAGVDKDIALMRDLPLSHRPPMVEPHWGRGSLSNLLKREPMALVVDKRGRVMGLIRPMDIA